MPNGRECCKLKSVERPRRGAVGFCPMGSSRPARGLTVSPTNMMSRAVLTALLAIMPALGLGAEDPKPPSAPQTQEPAAPPKTAPDAPAAAPAAGATDPAKLAEPAARAAAKVPGALPVDEKTYVIGAEDVLIVAVYEHPGIGCQCLVRPDGKITLTFIGDVTATGRTPLELGKDISERLNEFIVDPQVSVSLGAVHSKKYFLLGQGVKSPGQHDLIVPTTVMEALVGTGGFQDFANTKNIVIMRGDKRLKFNYNEVLKGKNLQQNIYVESGDMIVVK